VYYTYTAVRLDCLSVYMLLQLLLVGNFAVRHIQALVLYSNFTYSF